MAPQTSVTLHVYDLSGGMAKQFSPMILGKTVDGIWHTGIVAFGTEYYFGGGICSDPPGVTPYGVPIDRVSLGTTSKTQAEFSAFLSSISSQFSMSTYHVLDNNCNNFSDACAKYLLGSDDGIPNYIIDLPREAMDSPMGSMLRPMIENMQAGIRDQSAGHEVNFGAASGPGPGLESTPIGQTPASSIAASPRSAAPSAISTSAREPLLLSACKIPPVLAKLREFDPEYPPPGSGDTAPAVDLLLAAESRAESGRAFPALDLLRIAALRDAGACGLVAKAAPRLLARHVVEASAPRPDRMMALRVAVNTFKFEAGTTAMVAAGVVGEVVEAAALGLENEHPAVAKTAAMLALNVAGAPLRFPGKVVKLAEEHNVRLLFALIERAKCDSVPMSADESYPLLGAIGCLVNGDADARELARTLDFDLTPFLDPTRCMDVKTRALANELGAILQQ